ncbi:NADPH dehydrogenase NamA [Exiguobacterium oxidotolerans]|uniref:NADPH-dependent flavin oxidoreductase (Acting on cinnamaldehyde-related compounds) n=1 Tax=Exiguobacterium oxidotolerans TaxID=223958 RepID=A0A653I3J5_9BACL|nr:NADPH dehydrogenase NamA [Exiguobacterium oxidotolerans]VWX33259.1 NADPH-dependent flavin oxidoreductase (acting on cinnamaldehyde-related compounds) [Exiguobacterium oxidotolerans]
MKAKLFEAIEIGNVTFRNRVIMAPMCMYSAKEDGKVTDWHVTHYASRAVGGVGGVMLEATAVTPDGRISAGDLGIWSDSQIEGLRRIAEQVQAAGAKAGVQLAHAGRKSTTARPPVAPSPIAFDDSYGSPAELSIEDIKKIQQQFIDAALRVEQAGYDFIELHGAHGYLINTFLSPLSNERNDQYGGSLENRMRFLLEIIEGIQAKSDISLWVRISAADHAPGGMTATDYIPLAEALLERGIDLLDCSSGAVVANAVPEVYPGYQVPYAAELKQATGIKTGAVGLITTATMAEEIIRSQRADVVLLARELLRQPYWVHHAAAELHDEVLLPKQYERAPIR